MEFSNEYWKLVITPRYVRKDTSKFIADCFNCKGSGIVDNPDPTSLIHKNMCFHCRGLCKIEVLPEIPHPPEIDHKFLEDLEKWFENYKELQIGEKNDIS